MRSATDKQHSLAADHTNTPRTMRSNSSEVYFRHQKYALLSLLLLSDTFVLLT
jgi:hypothetical protein